MPVTDLVKAQVDVEATWGVCGTADHLLMGITDATLNIMDSVHQVERSGWYYPSDLVAQVQQHGEGSLSIDLSYEEILYMLDNFFDAETPATSTTTTGTVTYTYYNWAYDAPTDTTVTPSPLTIEFGAPNAQYQACGLLFTELNISGEAGGVWTGTFPFLAQEVNTVTMATVTDSAVELIRMADTEIYMDTWAGTIGTTKKDDALISFDLSVTSGRHLKQFGGELEPQDWGDTQWTGTLTTVLEFTAAVKSHVDDLLDPTATPIQRMIRIQADNDATAVSGNDRIATIDFYGTLVDGVELFGDRDGNVTISLTWQGTWNDTDSAWLGFDIKNVVTGL